jgi:hypothetical protein
LRRKRVCGGIIFTDVDLTAVSFTCWCTACGVQQFGMHDKYGQEQDYSGSMFTLSHRFIRNKYKLLSAFIR